MPPLLLRKPNCDKDELLHSEQATIPGLGQFCFWLCVLCCSVGAGCEPQGSGFKKGPESWNVGFPGAAAQPCPREQPLKEEVGKGHPRCVC
jgi:hypothetical protein